MGKTSITDTLTMLQGLTDQELEQVVIVARSTLAVRRTRRARLLAVARNRAQQGIEAPRRRGQLFGSPDQSSEKG